MPFNDLIHVKYATLFLYSNFIFKKNVYSGENLINVSDVIFLTKSSLLEYYRRAHIVENIKINLKNTNIFTVIYLYLNFMKKKQNSVKESQYLF